MKLIPKQVLETIEKWATIFSLSAIIFISILLVEAVILALISQYKAPFVYFSLIPAFVIAIFFSIQIKKDIKLLPNMTIPVLLLIFLVSLILIFYPHDTFGGRDEANYMNAAVHLANTASLDYPLYLNNLVDNFVESIRTVPPAYVVWLAIQLRFLGIQVLLRGNILIIILGLSALFLTSSFIGKKRVALLTVILFSSCMPFLWFSRETMSENLSLFLLWSLILFLFIFLRTKRLIYISITFLCSWLFALTRIEGFFIQLLLCFIIPIILYLYRVANLKRIFIVVLVYFFLVISNIIIVKNSYFPFLKEIVSAVKYSTIKNIKSILPEKEILTFKLPQTELNKAYSDELGNKFILFYSLMLAKYNLLIIILSIFLAIPLFSLRYNKIKNSVKYFFIILLIIFPEFLKLIGLNVTLDQPWLYRRYLYALLPLGYLSFSFLINELKNKKLLIILFSSFFIINFILSYPILFLKNNWMLINKLNDITKDISRNDFVIIRDRPFGYYSPISFLIINKGIRSSVSSILRLHDFFPNKNTFNGVSYNKIFLLSANDKDSYPSFKIASRKLVDVEYNQIIPSCQLYLLGDEKGLADPYNIGTLPFSDVSKYCSKPGNEIIHLKETFYLYELVYDKAPGEL